MDNQRLLELAGVITEAVSPADAEKQSKALEKEIAPKMREYLALYVKQGMLEEQEAGENVTINNKTIQAGINQLVRESIFEALPQSFWKK